MGNFLSTEAHEEPLDSDISSKSGSSNTKRKARDWEGEGYSEFSSFSLNERKKLKSTSQYIYNALFVDGENSDITIQAFNHEWKLHKVYLRQAGYFSGMFHGDWKESGMHVIHLQIPDPKIDKEALHIALGSLYSDEVVILPGQVVSVLAAASLIQLEGLMQQCSEVMIGTVCCENVCCFYNEARIYGQFEVEKACLKWLENNLMLQARNRLLLHEIEPALMTRIIESQNMFVLQVEMDVYTMLKKWLFLRISPDGKQSLSEKESEKHTNSAIKEYFRQLYGKTGQALLESEDGAEYVDAFQAIRFCNVIRDFSCCLELEEDGLIPYSWLMPLYRERWLTMLRVEQGVDRGPNEATIPDNGSLRCGRLLVRDTDYCWRWNGYNFGLDLLITYNSQAPKTLLLKRNIQSQRRIASVSLIMQRRIRYHLRVFSLSEKGDIINSFSTGPTTMLLEKDEEKVVLTLDEDSTKKLKFPLLISASFRVVSGQDMGNNTYKINPLTHSSQDLCETSD